MKPYLIQKATGLRLDDIYRYTLNQWGNQQAEHYIRGLFEQFDNIAAQTTFSRPIPAEFGVDGFFSRYEHHIIYWKPLSTGQIGIVTVLHEKMHQIERFKEDFTFNQTSTENP
jgi:toxin ParE1/3/4